MKKTLLITLCALALPAMADNFTLDYTQGEAVKVTNALPTLIDSTALTLTDVSLTYPGGGTPAVIGGDGNASTYVSHFYAPWLNFKNNAQGWTYTLTFKAEANISLTDIQVALFTCNMGGTLVANATPFNGKTSANYSLTLAAAASASTPLISGSSSETPFSNHGGNANSTPAYDFGTSSITTGSGSIVSASSQTPVLLTEGEKYVLTLTVDKANKASNAFGVGIGGINLVGSVVPEPATATLSLLALAGLAARRRRK